MQYLVETLPEFDSFLGALKDERAQAAIADRLVRMEFGLFGDVQPVGEGVSEMRIHAGPGYRAYFVIRRQTIVIVLCGGSKRTQKQDIRRAKELARTV